MSPFQFYERNLEALLPPGHKEIVLEALTQWKADTRYEALTEANTPESKPAADWASEWLGYNVGPEQKRLVEWIDEIKANTAAHARYQALTEAAEHIVAAANSWRGAHMNTNETCGSLVRLIRALRDAKE
jgi:hypothetical protein